VSDTSHDADEIAAYYAQGLEHDGLSHGPGTLELARTRRLLERYLPAAPAIIADECAEAGLVHETTLAVEGAGWLLPDLDARLADARRRDVVLGAIAALEAEPTLLGVSAHLLAVARRP